MRKVQKRGTNFKLSQLFRIKSSCAETLRDRRSSLRCVVFAPFWSKKSSGAARLARRLAAPFPSLRPPFWKERSLRGAGLWRSRRCRFARFVAGTVRGGKKRETLANCFGVLVYKKAKPKFANRPLSTSDMDHFRHPTFGCHFLARRFAWPKWCCPERGVTF